jgi:hypothetical protein
VHGCLLFAADPLRDPCAFQRVSPSHFVWILPSREGVRGHRAGRFIEQNLDKARDSEASGPVVQELA